MSEAVLGQDLTGSKEAGSDNFNFETFAAENIGEGKKYATTEEAFGALSKKAAHQDTFIETLKLEKEGVEREKGDLENRLKEAKTVDDLLKAVTDPETETPTGGGNSAQVSKEQITTIVTDLLKAEKEATAVQSQTAVLNANRDKAFESLSKSAEEGGFGSEANAKEAILRYVGDDKTKADLINRMGAYQPDSVAGFLKLQLNNSNKMEGLHGSEMSVTEEHNHNKGKLTWAQAQKIRKENPKLYRSREFQMQLHHSADTNENFWN